MAFLVKHLKSLIEHKLARNASWMLLGQGANLLLQAASFVLLARLLGVTEYGIFAGAFAFVNIVSPYSALGSNMLFMRYVSVDHSQATAYWGNMLILASIMTVLIAGFAVFTGPSLTRIHSTVIFAVLAVANCFLGQISALASTVFQTFEKMRWSASLSFLSNLIRIFVLILMLTTMHRATAVQWSIGWLAASAVAALMSLVWVQREIGSPSLNLRLIRTRMWEGIGFSFAGTTQSLYNDVDKTMLSHYGLHKETGFYSLAYRIVDFCTTPMSAIVLATIPRSFRLSQQNAPAVARFGFKSARIAVVLGIAIAAGTMLLAPVVPRIVGRDFSGVLIALRWLCWIPLLRGLHYMTGSAITALGRQNLRTAAQFTVAGTNVLLNLWWIPAYGWIGAAWSSVACDGLLAILNVSLLLWLSNRLSGEAAHSWTHPTGP